MYKVILVDDEYMIIKGLEKLIDWESLNLELIGSCANGKEAYEFVKEHHVDIVITDVNMPFMDGIEFVKKTQAENLNFYVILLSGYQEFEYVKEGIQLGVENFLLKPIDKEMLNQTLQNTVVKLEEEQTKLESDKLLFSNTLLKWIHDEVELTDLRRILKLTGYPLTLDAVYSVLIFEENQEALKKFFDEMKQPFYFENHDEMVLIFEGDVHAFTEFRRRLSETFDLDAVLKGVGELFVKIDKVHQSYEQAYQNVSFLSFYKGHPISKLLQDQNMAKVSNQTIELDFSKFHQALSVRDEALIFIELRAIFDTLIENKSDPNYIRYLSFIIISDIYREFGISDAKIMNENVQSVYNSENIRKIQTTLYRVYHDVSESQKEVSYSELVRDLLFIMMERYYEDLSLLSIADELHVNSMYLGQLFKKELGVSFSKYLNSYRIKKAQELIINTGLNFSEISAEVGYSSPGYFYKKFKKECGFSPSEYRTKYRKA